MTAPLFVVAAAALAASDDVLVDGPEGRHAATVRRLRVGEQVDLTDGAGALARGRVREVSKAWLLVAVESREQQPEPAPRVVVVQALPKGDRAELAVETLTEVGVDVVVPWAAARCVTRWQPERAARSLERWRATAREAAKQSRRPWFPHVAPLAGTDEVAGLLRAAALGVVLHEAATGALATLTVPTAGDVVLVVGPEGGIDDSELAAFAAAGAATARLGPSVLRTSTAGTVAAAVLLARTPRWGGG